MEKEEYEGREFGGGGRCSGGAMTMANMTTTMTTTMATRMTMMATETATDRRGGGRTGGGVVDLTPGIEKSYDDSNMNARKSTINRNKTKAKTKTKTGI